MPKDQDSDVLKPTIVGGQPSEDGNPNRSIPRGMEALIKKASVDPEFRRLLLEKRADAAQEIDLELTAGEAATLNCIPKAQIDQIIDKTIVQKEHRRVFLGKVGAAMLAVLGMNPAAYAWEFQMGGIRADGWPYREDGRLVVLVNDGQPLLDVQIVDTGSDSVHVSVRYVSLFDKGLCMLYFIDEHKTFAENIECRPEVAFVSRGAGEATFRASGKHRTTDWAISSLVCSDPPCRHGVPGSLSDFLTQRKSQEYVIGEGIVWNVVRFHKEWKPKR